MGDLSLAVLLFIFNCGPFVFRENRKFVAKLEHLKAKNQAHEETEKVDISIVGEPARTAKHYDMMSMAKSNKTGISSTLRMRKHSIGMTNSNFATPQQSVFVRPMGAKMSFVDSGQI
mmetsp:Transcript_31724/g.48628  ORF Transcript_31724/g.48628 Transcript_31724/m.48628 type:complete len:117 (-) Transcript_31724:253-603(-)